MDLKNCFLRIIVCTTVFTIYWFCLASNFNSVRPISVKNHDTIYAEAVPKESEFFNQSKEGWLNSTLSINSSGSIASSSIHLSHNYSRSVSKRVLEINATNTVFESLEDAEKQLKLNSSDVAKNTLHKQHHPLILYWNHQFYDRYAALPEGSMKYPPCKITYQRGRIRQAAAVVFHYMVITDDDMPWINYRHPNQVFVWWSAEPPSRVKQYSDLRVYNDFFNWTWTYRRDSDVFRLYGYRGKLLKRLPLGKISVDRIISSKEKLAVWFVGNCNETFGAKLRMDYYQEMIRHGLSITCYGKCCSDGFYQARRVNKRIIQKHKFYLAFENSLHCKDYITEKFWDRALGNDAVPVVWGPQKEDILSVAPLDSFIFAEDFESPKQLVDYLEFLDGNDKEYRKFFRWREDVNMTDEEMIRMTKLRFPELQVQENPKTICQKVMENRETKTIHSLAHEFFETNPTECIQ